MPADPPSIQLTAPDSAPNYMEDQLVDFTCQYDGVPKPDVYWNWQPCEHAGCEASPLEWRRVALSKNIPEIKEQEGKTILTVNARESGFYQCEAENKVKKVSDHVSFFVTGN